MIVIDGPGAPLRAIELSEAEQWWVCYYFVAIFRDLNDVARWHCAVINCTYGSLHTLHRIFLSSFLPSFLHIPVHDTKKKMNPPAGETVQKRDHTSPSRCS